MATNNTRLSQVLLVLLLFLTNTAIHAFVHKLLVVRQVKTTTTTTTVYDSSSSSVPPQQTLYPPLSKKEIEEWLDYIPVYTITDPKGNFIYIEPTDQMKKNDDDETSTKIFNFYIDSQMAKRTLQQLKFQLDSPTSDVESKDLKLSAFSLGKVWFDLLMAKKKDNVNDDDDEEEETIYHLVASEQDLLGARMLLTMDSEEEEALMKATSPEQQKQILDRINEGAPKFKIMSLNEIPVFMIGQMRLAVEGKPMIPMYLSNEDMISTYQQFLSKNKDKAPAEPSIQLLELHEIVDLMERPCAFDFRSVMLLPPKEGETDENPPAKTTFGQGLNF